MITVIRKKGSIEVSGHSGYEDIGKDIVCASCSTAIIQACNIIEALGKKDFIKTTINDAYMLIEILKEDETVSKILETLVQSLKDLEDQYPNFIKVK